MYSLKDLANLIFPDVTKTVEDLENQFPERKLGASAEVTRFAPSPTGFLHTGSLFTALIGQKIAKQSGGVFYTRLEDTDTKREVQGSGKELLDQLAVFGVIPDEGYFGDSQKGSYGPYIQSERENIYRIVIKELMLKGRAYPCFCSKEDLEKLRAEQEKNKIIPGYYGEYAKCRNLSVDEEIEKIKNGESYVIRFKSLGNHLNKIKIHDEIRGNLELAENDQDIVILKGDGLPTYHFAHLVDDHFMRTTVVTRGEEWLSSLPIHLELFSSMNWKAPKYAHLPVIMKLDNGNRRKLSKRKDNEAAISYFLQDGYPVQAIKEYLFTIANSNYEEWHMQNPTLTLEDFKLSFEKMQLDGALFDLPKLQYFSKEVLGTYSAHRMLVEAKEYARKYDEKLLNMIEVNENYFEQIMNIEKDKPNPRKDYVKFSDIFEKIKFFYDDYYDELMSHELPFNPNINKDVIISCLEDFRDTLNYDLAEQEWFNNLKVLGYRHGFAGNGKEYKQNKDKFIGQVGDVAEMIRIALTSSKQSPNIYYVLKILGKEKIALRINKTIEIIK